MQRFTNLRAWQHAHRFTLQLYKWSRALPHDGIYGLRAQLRRASVSICANIAEGAKRATDADFARCLNIAAASAAECEALLLICKDLGFLRTDDADALIAALTDVQRLLHGLRQSCIMPAQSHAL